MKKKLFYTAMAALLVGAAFCSCSKDSDDDDNGGNGGGGGKLPDTEKLLDGPYSIKFELTEYDDEKEYCIFTSNGDRNKRMDYIYETEIYGGQGDYEGSEGGGSNEPTIGLSYYIYISGRDKAGNDFGYTYYGDQVNGGTWEDDEWAGNSINNERAEYTLDPKYYEEVGFKKDGKITVLGKELDLYVGTKEMLKDFFWVGYDHIGSFDYSKLSFAYDGGIVMYMAKDDKVQLKAVAVTTTVPDVAFTKQVDVTWLK